MSFLFLDEPALGPWLASPEAAARLFRFVGAALYGSVLSRVIDSGRISALTSEIGDDAWRFGVGHALNDLELGPVPRSKDIIEAGQVAVLDFLLAKAPDVTISPS